MQLNRRNTIIGLGALAGGGGLITATGAFDAVEADRSFEVEVAGDADALLGLEAVNDAIAGTEDTGAGENEVLFFQLDDEEVEESALNEDAETKFFEVFTIANNGSQDGIDVSIDTGDAEGVHFEVLEDPAREPEGINNSDVVDEDRHLEDDGVELNQGEIVSVDLTINTRASGDDGDEDGGYVDPEEGNDGDPYEMTLTALSPDAQDEEN